MLMSALAQGLVFFFLERFGPRNVWSLAIIIMCIYFFCYGSDVWRTVYTWLLIRSNGGGGVNGYNYQ